MLECPDRPGAVPDPDEHGQESECLSGTICERPGPRCHLRCSFGYSGPAHCDQLCRHARGHDGSHDCMKHICRPKRPPPGPPPVRVNGGMTKGEQHPPDERPLCQCWCGCRRQPGRRCRRHCPLCSRLVGPGCCWMGNDIGLCHMCYQRDAGRSEEELIVEQE